MKIGFNAIGCGLGNNGGTRTILKCGEALSRLGHKVFIIATVNKFTWFPAKNVVSKIPPGLDALIAVHGSAVESTLKSGAKIKAWYIRSADKHLDQSFQKKLVSLYNKPILKIVNSNGLKKRIKGLGITHNIHVVPQGINLDFWSNRECRPIGHIRIGCLYSKSEMKRWKDFRELSLILGNKFEYVGFGSSKCNDNFLTSYLTQPGPKKLRNLYSSCHFWFAPTISEGLHNVPMEAALCGALIVCSNNDDNGMIHDYAFDNKTARVYSNIKEAANICKEHDDWSLIDNMTNHLRKKIGSWDYNMNRLVNILCQN